MTSMTDGATAITAPTIPCAYKTIVTIHGIVTRGKTTPVLQKTKAYIRLEIPNAGIDKPFVWLRAKSVTPRQALRLYEIEAIPGITAGGGDLL